MLYLVAQVGLALGAIICVVASIFLWRAGKYLSEQGSLRKFAQTCRVVGVFCFAVGVFVILMYLIPVTRFLFAL